MSTVENENKAVEAVESVKPVKGGKKNVATKRHFTVIHVTKDGQVEDFKGGKFPANTPAGAARKAANQACKQLYGKEDCTIEIAISEITKNHPSKEYAYQATRTRGTKNVDFKESGVKIPFEFSMVLKSLKKTKDGKKEVTPVTDEATAIEEKTV